MLKQTAFFILCFSGSVTAADLSLNEQLALAVSNKNTDAIVEALANNATPDNVAIAHITSAIGEKQRITIDRVLLASLAGTFACYAATQFASGDAVNICFGLNSCIVTLASSKLLSNDIANSGLRLSHDDQMLFSALNSRMTTQLTNMREPGYADSATEYYKELCQYSSPDKFESSMKKFDELARLSFDLEKN